MDKNSLDNMSGQEIKEMIDNEIIDLDKLDNSALEKVLNFEIDMLCLGTGDMKTIRQCSKLLDERSTSDILNDDEIMSIVDKTKAEYVTIVNQDKKNNPSVVIPQRKKHFTFRKIGLIAAAVALMLTCTALVATAFGFDILTYFKEVVGLPAGSTIEQNDVTFIHNGEIVKYNSIDTLLKENDLDIMYPSKLPDDVHIKKVNVINGIKSEKEITIFTTDSNCILVVYVNLNEVDPELNDSELFLHNGVTYYIRSDENYAFCYYKNNYYSIKANSYDDLITIIENMKE